MFHSILYSLIIPAVSPFFEPSISLTAVLRMTSPVHDLDLTKSRVRTSSHGTGTVLCTYRKSITIVAGIYVIRVYGMQPKMRMRIW